MIRLRNLVNSKVAYHERSHAQGYHRNNHKGEHTDTASVIPNIPKRHQAHR